MQNVLVPICRKQKVWHSLLKSPDNSKQHIPLPLLHPYFVTAFIRGQSALSIIPCIRLLPKPFSTGSTKYPCKSFQCARITPKHSHLKPKTSTRSRQTPPRNTKRLETVSRNSSAQHATFTVTHPSIPSLGRGNTTPQTTHFQTAIPPKNNNTNQVRYR